MQNSKFYNEMITQVGLCSHPAPEKLLIVSDYGFDELTSKHLDVKDVQLVTLDDSFDFVRDAQEKSFDLLIINSSKYSEDKIFIAHCNRVLKADGILVIASNINENISSFFKICMPYRFEASKDSTELFTATFATKKYHPTADMILHKSDLLEGLEYYNSDIHKASFILPNHLKNSLKGILKN
jgi:spermidine synthase